MLREYAVTPEVLLRDSYENGDLYRLAVRQLWEEAKDLGLFRDLADRKWSAFLAAQLQARDDAGRHMLKALITRRRLIGCKMHGAAAPANWAEWWLEALREHEHSATTGVILSPRGKAKHPNNNRAADILQLEQHDWWTNRQSHRVIKRSVSGLLDALVPIFKRANRLDFVDPYIAPPPHREKYSNFPILLRQIQSTCRITIHRIDRPDTATQAGFKNWAQESERRFTVVCRKKNQFTNPHVPAHDRFLISDLLTITATNGFDVDGKAMTITPVIGSMKLELERFFCAQEGSDQVCRLDF